MSTILLVVHLMIALAVVLVLLQRLRAGRWALAVAAVATA